VIATFAVAGRNMCIWASEWTGVLLGIIGLHSIGMGPAFVSRQTRLRATCSQAVYTEAIKIAAVLRCR